MHWAIVLFIPFLLYSTDYDCIFIGSSPIPLFEALYQETLGKRVLILEGAERCGGAWQSIDICGVSHSDLGCHMIGTDQNLATFFYEYAGCEIISLDLYPKARKDGFYFKGGCHELIKNLQQRIKESSVDLLLKQEVTQAVVDQTRRCVVVQTQDKQYTAEKVFFTPYTYFPTGKADPEKSKFYHLYLLIVDPSPVRFSYEWGVKNATRIMNVTPFIDLPIPGTQLIILQTYNRESFNEGELFLKSLKEKNLVDSMAFLIDAQSNIYEQWPANRIHLHKEYPEFFEVLDTYHLLKISHYMERWKTGLKKFNTGKLPFLNPS